MTREQFRVRGFLAAFATFLLPLMGIIALLIKPLDFLAAPLIYSAPVIFLIIMIAVKIKEKNIPWQRYKCPHCGEYFEATPGNATVRHLMCDNKIRIQDGILY